MQTLSLSIRACNRSHPIRIVGPADFDCESATEISPEAVKDDPRFSLYCADPENDAAVFVKCVDPEAVERAPFYYQAQAEHAIDVVKMPMELFHRLAETISYPPAGLVFVHSVGRCGSTLLSKVLEAARGVRSLSEPDDLTQMVLLKNDGTVSDEWLKQWVVSSIRWRCKSSSGAPPTHVAIKMRSEVMVLADMLGTCFPDSKHLFLYRDGVSWMRSVFRNFPADRNLYDAESNREMEANCAKIFPLVLQYRREGEPMNPCQTRILAWITGMEAYMALVARVVPLIAARFEDLVSQPGPMLSQILDFCGIPAPPPAALVEVLGRDSQAGTVFDREERRKNPRELPLEMVRAVETMIATRPLLRTPGVLLPGTLTV